ncbi:MAG: UPF0175 family protein [Candidatus Contendobacter sp.]
MTQVVLDFEPSAFSALRLGPAEFTRELKTAAIVQWYAEGRISQSKSTEILGISRVEFLNELCRRKVPACQVTIEELREEISGF